MVDEDDKSTLKTKKRSAQIAAMACTTAFQRWPSAHFPSKRLRNHPDRRLHQPVTHSL
jgi:hypothetical protein